MLQAKDAIGEGDEVQEASPDGPTRSTVPGVPIKRRSGGGGAQETPTAGVALPGNGFPRPGQRHTAPAATASLLTLSLVGLMTSVLAAAAVLAAQSATVVLRLPTSVNLGILDLINSLAACACLHLPSEVFDHVSYRFFDARS